MKEIVIMENLDANKVIGKILLADMVMDNLCDAIYKLFEVNKTLPTIEFAYGGQVTTFDENPVTFHFQSAAIRLQEMHELQPVQSKKDVIMVVGMLQKDLADMAKDEDQLSVGTLAVVKAVTHYANKLQKLLGVEVTENVTLEPKHGIPYYLGDQYDKMVSEGKNSTLFGQRIGQIIDIDDLYAVIGWLCVKNYKNGTKSEKEP